MKLTGPNTLRLDIPSDGVRARLEAAGPLIAKLQPDGQLKTEVDLNVRIDTAALNEARIGVNWGSPPSIPVAWSPPSGTVPTPSGWGWLKLGAVMVLAALLAVGLRMMATTTWRVAKPDPEELALTVLAPLFVPMFLDVLGKSVMKDLDNGGFGVTFVFFSYCFVAATLGARFVFPFIRGFEILLSYWGRTGGWPGSSPPADRGPSTKPGFRL